MTREAFIEFIRNHKTKWSQLMKLDKYKEYYGFMHSWSQLLENDFFTDVTRVYWIIHDIHDYPRCKISGKQIIKNAYTTNKACYTYYSNEYRAMDKDISRKYHETCLKRYGVDSASKRKEFREKYEKTCMDRYGVKVPSKLDSAKKKMRETNLRKYGNNVPMGNKDVHKKYEETCKKNFGVDNPFKNASIREKSKRTCLKKYGNEDYTKTQEFKDKRKKTSQERHGVDHFTNLEKAHQTMTDRYGGVCQFGNDTFKSRMMDIYGVENSMQLHDCQVRAKSPYFYDNQYFKSSWEIAFYIYHKDNGHNITHNPDIEFKYYDGNNTEHFYFPDFKIDDKLYEIKGGQFIESDGTYTNPYDTTQKHIYEAKHKCMVDNNIIIVSTNEIKMYLKYVKDKYSKNYIKSFKVKE